MYLGVHITNENISRFSHLIPEIYVEDLLSGNLTGAALIDVMHGDDAIMGVMLLRAWNGWMEIRWIKMSEAYDTDDYGADLIWNVTEFLRGWENYRGIYAKIYPKETKALSYFRMAGFNLKEDHDNILEFTMGEIVPGSYLTEQEGFEFCHTLGDMTSEQKLHLENMLHEASEPLAIEFPIDYDSFDQDLSAVYEDKGTVKAVIFFTTDDRWITVNFAHAAFPMAFVTLLSFIYQWATMMFTDDQRILVPVLSWKGVEIVNKLVPGAHRQKLWLATREYELKRD